MLQVSNYVTTEMHVSLGSKQNVSESQLLTESCRQLGLKYGLDGSMYGANLEMNEQIC